MALRVMAGSTDLDHQGVSAQRGNKRTESRDFPGPSSGICYVYALQGCSIRLSKDREGVPFS